MPERINRKHYYEIIRLPFDHPSGEQRERWKIIQHQGKSGSIGRGYIYPDPGPDISDEMLIRRSGIGEVTVPIIVTRGDA